MRGTTTTVLFASALIAAAGYTMWRDREQRGSADTPPESAPTHVAPSDTVSDTATDTEATPDGIHP